MKGLSLPFDAGAADTFHDVLPEEDKEQEQGNGDGDGRGHLVPIFGDSGVDIDEGGRPQTIGDEAVVRLIGNQVGPDVGVPGTHELEDGDGDEGG